MDSNHIFSEEQAQWLFGEKVLSLQQLAGFQFAWNLWSDFMLSGKYHNIKSDLKAALAQTIPVVRKFIHGLKLAPAVEGELMEGMYQVEIQLILWIVYNRDHMLAGRPITLYTCHLKYIAFKPNTDLDYEACARKMLSSKQFVGRAAFEVMCRFAMEPELRKLPKDEVKGYLKKFTFQKTPVAWYWACYLVDKKMLKGCGEMLCYSHGECCVEAILITDIDAYDWVCVKWFWNHLCSEDDKTRKAIDALRNINKNWFLGNFYRLLDEDQWRTVFNAIPVDILFVFFRQYKKPDQGFFLWERFRDTMAGDQFVDLIDRLLNEKDKDWCFPTITKLWNTAPDHLKNYLLSCGNYVIMDDFFESTFICKYDKNLQFLFELLTYSSIEYRQKMILTRGDVLFEVDDFSKIDKIVELCLPDTSQRDKFKKFLCKSKVIWSRCEKQFENGNFAFLNKFFESYCPYESVANNYRKLLMSSNKTCEAFIFEPSVWCEVEKFISSIDSNTLNRTSIRNQILRSCKLDYFNDWSNVEQIDHLENVLVQYFTPQQVDKLKSKFLNELQSKLSEFFNTFVSAEGKFFTAKFLEKFVQWTTTGDDRGLKSTLNIDSIFTFTLTSLMRVIRFEDLEKYKEVHEHLLTNDDKLDRKILVALDEFLRWYFEGAERAKKYKLDKIFAFDDVRFFRDMNKTAKIDGRNFAPVLVWMLENDEEEIRKFKAKCSYEDILKAI
ncbi:uncharacterized protein LOC135850085 isoform X5 [Planococcus citri]|uniref:uncharacterized protein LOC135850085 isoform X5 n=1 Tax=Planococcus citri TaxID=170843 RepID=UPI0031F75739